ncbi:uncharacterized protein C8Q71DRAFT_697742 [Rhodofomes roseus]|uniref:Uncharacterized protein n=1 Tax=Rhodofomes roseus TaxID=34475 RepID=A0ABQ8KX25_9APHY|nr:uncharacterized protein C8Q71DRAFT_697742 [Rhodofomes roseus]KAH9843776.1 hypothetical protein C8Q71DRAFT_697742 [Rhodofomes roseus]
MLCNGSTSSASAFLHTVARRGSALRTRYNGPCPAGRSVFCRQHPGSKVASFFNSSYTRGAAALVFRQAPDAHPTTVDSQPPDTTESNHFLLSLTAGQISRASAQAVRLSVRNCKYGDALYLINSLLESHNPESLASSRSALIDSKSHSPASPAAPIDFGRPISPRVPAHAFLHALVRAGLAKRAASYAAVFQDCGIQLRPATVTLLIHSLTSTPSKPLGGLLAGMGLHGRRKKVPAGENVLKIRSSMVSDTCTRAAVKLMLHARMQGQRRTEYTYNQIIKNLLLHGEIIMGSLFVVLFFKCMELQKARADMASDASADANAAPLCADGCSPFVPIRRDYSFHLSRTAVDTMNSVLREMDKAMESLSSAEADDDRDRLASILQALANLAMLLDTGQLPTDRISTLVRTLYSCPKTNQYVWILDGSRKPVRVKAYRYFHNVLMRLIHSLTKPDPMDRPPPHLDIGSYNTLLFYALRHRVSPALASGILDHMYSKREPPLKSNIVTYNTLLRAGTLLRRKDISDFALRALRGGYGRSGADVLQHSTRPGVLRPDPEEPLAAPAPILGSQRRAEDPPAAKSSRDNESSSAPQSYTLQSRVLRRLSEEDWDVPEAFSGAQCVTVDAHTFVSFISYITATGKPGVIVNVLFRMLPELAIVDHPTWGHTDDSRQRARLSLGLRKRYLRQAVRHGPRVFSALLNALAKAKATGAAERVWLLAKQAEKASWLPNFVPDVKPWCLPVHAYTSMMRCYAQEARRAITLNRREQAVLDKALQADENAWVPLFRGGLPGWAAFVATMQKLQLSKYSKRRRRLRSVSALLHRCMVSAGLSLYRALLAMAKTQSPRLAWKGRFPAPDERFFNEALDLFGRQLSMASRERHTTPRCWRKCLNLAWRDWQRQGVKGQGWTAALQEVMQGIVDAGLPVPPGFRASSVGHWDQVADSTGRTRTDRRRRYAFPAPPARFRSHALVTVKTRGLPLPRHHHRTKSRSRSKATNK